MEETTQEVTPDEVINNEVAKFDYAAAKIEEFKEFLKLKVNGVEDKEGLKKVHDSRMIVRDERILLDKQRKAATEKALLLQRSINQKCAPFREAMEEIEKALLIEENKVEEEKERLRQEKIKTEELRVQNRVAALFRLGMAFNGAEYILEHIVVETLTVKELPDENWDALLLKIDDTKKKIDQEKAEEKRLKEEQEEKDKKAREQENIRLESIRQEQEKERLRLEELNRQQEERNKKLQEETEQMEKQHAEKVRLLREETEKLVKEKRDLEEQKNAELQKKRYSIIQPYSFGIVPERLWEKSEEEFKVLCDNTRTEYDRINKEKEEREEREREAKRKTDERIRLREESLRPDKDKLIQFAANIKALECPEVNSVEAQEIIKKAAEMIGKLSDYVSSHAQDL